MDVNIHLSVLYVLLCLSLYAFAAFVESRGRTERGDCPTKADYGIILCAILRASDLIGCSICIAHG